MIALKMQSIFTFILISLSLTWLGKARNWRIGFHHIHCQVLIDWIWSCRGRLNRWSQMRQNRRIELFVWTTCSDITRIMLIVVRGTRCQAIITMLLGLNWSPVGWDVVGRITCPTKTFISYIELRKNIRRDQGNFAQLNSTECVKIMRHFWINNKKTSPALVFVAVIELIDFFIYL